MSSGRILGLFAIVLALGGYLYFYEIPQAQKESQKEKLLAVDQDAVNGIELIYPDRSIELRKAENGWRVVKPVDAPADETAVKAVIAAVADAEVQKALDDMPSDLAPFGLTTPNPVVKLTVSKGEQPPPVAVGAPTKIGGKAYVRRGEEKKILLTLVSIGPSLNKQPKDLRDKQILSFKEDDVTRIDIASAKGAAIALAKKDKDAWTISPGDFPADPNEVRAYLSSLRTSRALDFADDTSDRTKLGLDAPQLTITVTSADNSTQKLLLGGEFSAGQQKQIYAQRDGQPVVVMVGEFLMRSLDKDVKALRDKTVLAFKTEDVAKIALARKDGSTTSFSKAKDGAWAVDGQDAVKSKATTIERFLDDVHDLRGSDIAAEPATDLAALGLDAPDLRITLTDAAGKTVGTVLASKQNAKFYALRDGGQTVFEVRDYMYTRLDKPEKEFVNDGSAPAAAATPPGSMPPLPIDEDDAGEADEE